MQRSFLMAVGSIYVNKHLYAVVLQCSQMIPILSISGKDLKDMEGLRGGESVET